MESILKVEKMEGKFVQKNETLFAEKEAVLSLHSFEKC